MEQIVDYLGRGFLQMVAGAAVIAIFLLFLREGGVLYEIVQIYMNGIGG